VNNTDNKVSRQQFFLNLFTVCTFDDQ
jgi:hypothetical protein